ncbi:MAG: DUF5011 domain-containing protein [Deltaproteobacteria bacterium]|nr:DUF5011 domain-containing protein [Deltaproteobacteria bacterium]
MLLSRHHRAVIAGSVLSGAVVIGALLWPSSPPGDAPAAPTEARPRAPRADPPELTHVDTRRALPLTFEENVGQTNAATRFLTRLGPDAIVHIGAAGGMSLVVSGVPRDPDPDPALGEIGPLAPAPAARRALVTMALDGAAEAPRLAPDLPLPGKVNYLDGSDPTTWRTDIATWARVTAHGVYPGIDLVYNGYDDRLEYDFVLGPGADPDAIRMRFTGHEALHIEPDGDLVVATPVGEIRHARPRLYQDRGERREEIPGRFVDRGDGVIGFDVGVYDTRLAMVIDPVLEYGSYWNGSRRADGRTALAVGADGTLIFAGGTLSTNLPVTPDALYPNATTTNYMTLFVSRFSQDGRYLLYSTYLGGYLSSGGAVGAESSNEGDAIVLFTIFQATSLPFVRAAQEGSTSSSDSPYLLRLAADGRSIAYASLLGGSWATTPQGLAMAPDGRVAVIGTTQSTFLATTNGTKKPSIVEATFAAVFDTSLSGSASVPYTTYFGSSTTSSTPTAVEFTSTGNLAIVGKRSGSDYPTTADALPFGSTTVFGFATVLVPDPAPNSGVVMAYSTLVPLAVNDVVVDELDRLVLIGTTDGDSFEPTTDAHLADERTGAGWPGLMIVDPEETGAAGLVHATWLSTARLTPYRLTRTHEGSFHILAQSDDGQAPEVNPLPGTFAGWLYIGSLDLGAPPEDVLTFATYLGDQIPFNPSLEADAAGSLVFAVATWGSYYQTTADALIPTDPNLGSFETTPYLARIGDGTRLTTTVEVGGQVVAPASLCDPTASVELTGTLTMADAGTPPERVFTWTRVGDGVIATTTGTTSSLTADASRARYVVAAALDARVLYQHVTVGDHVAPTIACAPAVLTAPAGSCAWSGALATPTVNDNCGSAALAFTSPDLSGPATLGIGPHDIVWEVTDLHGNTASCTQTVTVVEQTSPTITCPADLETGTDAGVCQALVGLSAAATDDCGIASVVDDRPAGSTFPLGSTTVTFTATDTSGNSTSCSVDVTVEDDESPSLVATPDATVEACVDSGPLLVEPAVADNCPATVALTHDAPAVFPIGHTGVIWTATDAAGNVRTQASATLYSASDTTAPVPTCPADVALDTCDDLDLVPLPSGSDACDPAPAVLQTPPFDCTAGSHIVPFIVRDASGNEALCEVGVEVAGAPEEPELPWQPDPCTQGCLVALPTDDFHPVVPGFGYPSALGDDGTVVMTADAGGGNVVGTWRDGVRRFTFDDPSFPYVGWTGFVDASDNGRALVATAYPWDEGAAVLLESGALRPLGGGDSRLFPVAISPSGEWVLVDVWTNGEGALLFRLDAAGDVVETRTLSGFTSTRDVNDAGAVLGVDLGYTSVVRFADGTVSAAIPSGSSTGLDDALDDLGRVYTIGVDHTLALVLTRLTWDGAGWTAETFAGPTAASNLVSLRQLTSDGRAVIATADDAASWLWTEAGGFVPAAALLPSDAPWAVTRLLATNDRGWHAVLATRGGATVPLLLVPADDPVPFGQACSGEVAADPITCDADADALPRPVRTNPCAALAYAGADIFPVGTTSGEASFTSTPPCGAPITCALDITVVDETPPTLTLDHLRACGDATPDLVGRIVAEDVCSGTSAAIQIPSAGTPLDGFVSIYTRVEDGAGNGAALLVPYDPTPPGPPATGVSTADLTDVEPFGETVRAFNARGTIMVSVHPVVRLVFVDGTTLDDVLDAMHALDDHDRVVGSFDDAEGFTQPAVWAAGTVVPLPIPSAQGPTIDLTGGEALLTSPDGSWILGAYNVVPDPAVDTASPVPALWRRQADGSYADPVVIVPGGVALDQHRPTAVTDEGRVLFDDGVTSLFDPIVGALDPTTGVLTAERLPLGNAPDDAAALAAGWRAEATELLGFIGPTRVAGTGTVQIIDGPTLALQPLGAIAGEEVATLDAIIVWELVDGAWTLVGAVPPPSAPGAATPVRVTMQPVAASAAGVVGVVTYDDAFVPYYGEGDGGFVPGARTLFRWTPHDGYLPVSASSDDADFLAPVELLRINAGGAMLATASLKSQLFTTRLARLSPVVPDPILVAVDVTIATAPGAATAPASAVPAPCASPPCAGVVYEGPDPLVLGPNEVTWIQVDACGVETDRVSIVVTVADQEPPTVVCTPVHACDQAIVPDYSAGVRASDNVTTDLTVTQAPAAGAAFDPTASPVVVTVTDEAGNTGACSFDVSGGLQIDDTPPLPASRDTFEGVVLTDVDQADVLDLNARGTILLADGTLRFADGTTADVSGEGLEAWFDLNDHDAVVGASGGLPAIWRRATGTTPLPVSGLGATAGAALVSDPSGALIYGTVDVDDGQGGAVVQEVVWRHASDGHHPIPVTLGLPVRAIGGDGLVVFDESPALLSLIGLVVVRLADDGEGGLTIGVEQGAAPPAGLSDTAILGTLGSDHIVASATYDGPGPGEPLPDTALVVWARAGATWTGPAVVTPQAAATPGHVNVIAPMAVSAFGVIGVEVELDAVGAVVAVRAFVWSPTSGFGDVIVKTPYNPPLVPRRITDAGRVLATTGDPAAPDPHPLMLTPAAAPLPGDAGLVTIAVDADCEGVMPDLSVGLELDDPCGVTYAQTPPIGAAVGLDEVRDATLTATDSAGNSSSVSVRVVARDLTGPVLTLTGGSAVVAECGLAFTDPGASAIDACEGDVSGTLQISGAVDTSAKGARTRTYSASDSRGNISEVTRSIEVTDTLAPVITILGSNPLPHQCGAAWSDPGATASDACDGDLTAAITADTDVHTGDPTAASSVTYRVKDAHDHETVRTRDVDVVDLIPPDAVCAQEVIVTIDESLGATLSAAALSSASTDACCLSPGASLMARVGMHGVQLAPPQSLAGNYVPHLQNANPFALDGEIYGWFTIMDGASFPSGLFRLTEPQGKPVLQRVVEYGQSAGPAGNITYQSAILYSTSGQLWAFLPRGDPAFRLLGSASIAQASQVRDRLYFAGAGNLYRLDGLDAAPAQIATGLKQFVTMVADHVQGRIVVFSGTFHAVAEIIVVDWDGTVTRSAAPSTSDGWKLNYAIEAVKVGATIYLVGPTPGSGDELWAYDGTTITRVADLAAGSDGSYPRSLGVVGGSVYFTTTGKVWRYAPGDNAPIELAAYSLIRHAGAAAGHYAVAARMTSTGPFIVHRYDANGGLADTLELSGVKDVRSSTLPIADLGDGTLYLMTRVDNDWNGGARLAIVGPQRVATETIDLGPSYARTTPWSFDVLRADCALNGAACKASIVVAPAIEPLCKAGGDALVVTPDGNGEATFTADSLDAGTTVAFGISWLTASADRLDCTTPGPNDVTLHVGHVTGHAAECTATVVFDDRPLAQCRAGSADLGSDGTGSIAATALDDGSDPCSVAAGWGVRRADDPGAAGPELAVGCADLGAPIDVVLEVEAADDTTTSCATIVSVTDAAGPVLDCHDTVTLTVPIDGALGPLEPADLDETAPWDCALAGSTLAIPELGVSGAASFAFGPSHVRVAPWVVTKTVADQAGNTSTCTVNIEVVPEVRPVCAGADPADPVVLRPGDDGTVDVVVTTLDGGSAVATGGYTPSASIASLACADAGLRDVTLTITQDLGFSATCTSWVFVDDAARATCRSPVEVGIGASLFGELVVADVDDRSDPCGHAQAITLHPVDDPAAAGPSIGYVCPDDIGATEVVLSVTDALGDVTTCNAEVVIEDVAPPTADCRQDAVVVIDESLQATLWASGLNQASDDCCIAGYTMPVGAGGAELASVAVPHTMVRTTPYSVPLTVTDCGGLTATCVASVTVQPAIEAECADPMWLQLGRGGMTPISGAAFMAGSSVAFGDFDLVTDPGYLDCTEVGWPVPVMGTLVHESGFAQSCDGTVWVTDDPVALCEPTTRQLDGGGLGSVSVGAVDAASYGPCEGVDVTIARPGDDEGASALALGCADVGALPVEVRASDSQGRTGVCTTTVSVRAPEAQCVAGLVVPIDATGVGTLDAASLDAGPADCGVTSRRVAATQGPSTTIAVPANYDAWLAPGVTVTQTITAPSDRLERLALTLTAPYGGTEASAVVFGVRDDGSPDTWHGVYYGPPLWLEDTATLTFELDVALVPGERYAIGFRTAEELEVVVGLTSDESAIPEGQVWVTDAWSTVGWYADLALNVVFGASFDSRATPTLTWACDAIGPHDTTLETLDVTGWASSCDTAVTVVDALAPTAVCASPALDLGPDDVLRFVAKAGGLIETFAGTGHMSGEPMPEDGAAATTIMMMPFALAHAADGTILIASATGVVWQVDPTSGLATRLAGGGSSADDGVPATDAALFPLGLALADDGTLYIADAAAARIRTIDPMDGTIGSLPIPAGVLALPYDITLDGAGGLLIADIAGFIHRWDLAAETIGALAGGGVSADDGALATEAQLGQVIGLAVAPDGAVHFTALEDMRVRRLYLDDTGDLRVGTFDTLDVQPVRVRTIGGDLYVTDFLAVHRYETDGERVTLAGGGASPDDGVPPTQAALLAPADLLVLEDGTLYVAEIEGARVRRVFPPDDNAVLLSVLDGGSSDNCGPVTLTSDADTLGCEALGTTVPIGLTLTDGSGNPATCTALVTLPIHARTRPATAWLDATGKGSIQPGDVDDGSTVTCGFELSVTPDTFSCADLGPRAVTLSTSDGVRSASDEATVEVRDGIDPTAVCGDEPAVVQLDADGAGALAGEALDGGSHDNCGVVDHDVAWVSCEDPTVQLGPADAVGCGDVGARCARLVVSDADGNDASCDGLVEVVDEVPPVVTCGALEVELDAEGVATLVMGASGGLITTIAGTGGYPTGIAPDGTQAADVAMGPLGVEEGPDGAVYVSDGFVGLWRIDPLTRQVTRVAGGGASDLPDAGDDGPATAAYVASAAQSVIAEDGTIYLAEIFGRVREIAPDGTISTLLDPTMGIAATSVDLDDSGLLYVASATGEVYTWDPRSETLTRIAGGGSQPVTPGAAAADVAFGVQLISVSVAPDGRSIVLGQASSADIYLLTYDEDDVLRVDIAGTTFYGTPPFRVELDGLGGFYAAETFVGLVWHFSGDPTADPALFAGDASGALPVQDGVAPTDTKLVFPIDVEVGPSGTIYIAEYGQGEAIGLRVRAIAPAVTGADLEDLVSQASDACGIDGIGVDLAWNDGELALGCDDVGDHAVEVSVTDVNDNVGSCTGTVRVGQSTTPTVIAQDITRELDADGRFTLHPDELDAGSTDICGVDLTAGRTDFGCAQVGDNVVTLTATNPGGKSAETGAHVVIEDNVAPTIAARDLTVALGPGGTVRVDPTEIDVGSFDACGIAARALSQVDFDCADLGDNDVTFTITDVNGNSSTTPVTITIVDGPAVITSCPDEVVITVEPTAGECLGVVPDLRDRVETASACAAATISQHPAPGTALAPGEHTVTFTAPGGSEPCTTTLTVLPRLQVVFSPPPLEDDNRPDDVDADADVTNKFRRGQVIPVKVDVLDCDGRDVTRAVADAITVTLDVWRLASEEAGGSYVTDVPVDFVGTGDVGRRMALRGEHFQYNLDTGWFPRSSTDRFFRVVVGASWNAWPEADNGLEDALLEASDKGR